MNKNCMNVVCSMAIGAAVGTALTAASAMCMNENKSATQKAMQKAKASKRILTKAGENIIKEITD